MTDLSTQLADAETRLEAARKMAGVAVLEGRDIDHMAMAAIEAEITSIHAAGGELARREREAAAVAERARREGLRQKLIKMNQERLEAAGRAEKAASDLCEALKLWTALNGEAARLVRALHGKGGAGQLDRNETEARMSRFLANAMKPLTGLGRKLGMITFPDYWNRFDGDWAKIESSLTEPEIQSALKGEDAW
jgi:hypothetical protein